MPRQFPLTLVIGGETSPNRRTVSLLENAAIFLSHVMGKVRHAPRAPCQLRPIKRRYRNGIYKNTNNEVDSNPAATVGSQKFALHDMLVGVDCDPDVVVGVVGWAVAGKIGGDGTPVAVVGREVLGMLDPEGVHDGRCDGSGVDGSMEGATEATSDGITEGAKFPMVKLARDSAMPTTRSTATT